MERVFQSFSIEDTKNIAAQLGRALSGGELIFFEGDLGAGKTAFVGGLCEGLGIETDVTSPTFNIVNEYRGEKNLFHFDMYRLNTEEELYSIGFYDYLDDVSVIAIEWSENVIDWLPQCDFLVNIEKLSENERKITVKGETVNEIFVD